MRFNPLNTLAGRLILVTVIAVALSHVIAFSLFANERSRSFRRLAESNVVERVAATYERLSGQAEPLQAQIARAASTRFFRFAIADTPLAQSAGHADAHMARAISTQLDGAKVRAISIDQDVLWPQRLRPPDDRGAPPGPNPGEGPPPAPPPEDAGAAHPPRDDHRELRRITDLTIESELGQGRWLRVNTYLPPPDRPPASLWFAAIASMLAVAVGAVFVSRQIGKPLSQLAGAAERLGHGEMNVAAPLSGPDDVRRAASAFNAMAERLGRQLSRQRHMLWALSHDLRTPITALKLRAELIEDEPARARLIAPIEEMQRLTEQALALARAGASEEARQRVDLAEIARTLCGELRDVGLNVTAEAETPVLAEVRPSEIARAMRNLAENAARHGGGGVMRVERHASGEAAIEVRDDGPGVPDELLQHLAEPFFRADPARPQDDGAGLGLAIAQAIAEAHGGRLELANHSPRGFSAKLVLPA